MNVFVTGGAGYVGSACLRYLLDRGHDAVAYDNLCQGHREAIPEGRLVVGELADMEDGPTFQKDVPKKEKKPTKTAANVDADDDDAPRPSMPRVSMGVMPSYSDDGKPGMLVDGLIEKGPAAEAGMKENDRIIKIGKQEVEDIYGYMSALAGFKPGDKVKVVVVRKDKELTVEVRLGKSPRRGGGGDDG